MWNILSNGKPFPTLRRRVWSILVCILMAIGGVLAMDRMGGELGKFLDVMILDGIITYEQSVFIQNHCMEDQFLYDRRGPALEDTDQDSQCAQSMRNYLNTEVLYQRMSRSTAMYLASMFRLDIRATTGGGNTNRNDASHYFSLSHHPVTKKYEGQGIVEFLGSANFSPPLQGTEERYNGIWGYAVGFREYALQCHSKGLDILDVTDPSSIIRIQYIPMTGGIIWRDVDIYAASNGKTYAYVAAQEGGGSPNLYVIDLSYLTGDSTPHNPDSNPIPSIGIGDRGETSMGHTLQTSQEMGLLVINSANPTDGCRIFDISEDPFHPKYLASHRGAGKDCHDSLIVAKFDGSHDVLLSADGYSGVFRIVDITDIRSGAPQLTVLGETQEMGYFAYAHSVSYFSRGTKKYLTVCDETNTYDMAIHDITDPSNIVLLGTFQSTVGGTSGIVTSGDHYVHNGHVKGDYLHVAYYEDGYRLFDISDPSNPFEAGKYETYQANNLEFDPFGGMNGAWNLHVGLPSGNILVSDQQSGTFVLRLKDASSPPAPASPTSEVSPAPSPASAPVASPTSSGQCFDIPGWYAIDPFFDCNFFARSGCFDFVGGFGLTAASACCACGGGTTEGGDGGGGDVGQCQDVPGWNAGFDSLDCSFLASIGCYDMEWNGHSTSSACCACGGGIYSNEENDDTNVPVPAPSQSPISAPTVSQEGFYIQLMNMGTESRYDGHFANAAARWRAMLIATQFPPVPAGTVQDLFDGVFSTAVDVNVDFILVGYSVEYIDGFGNVLGLAGPTTIDVDENWLPKRTVAAIMKFDAVDFASMSDEDIEIVIMHEFGHVFGLGTFWSQVCGMGCAWGDTRYTCSEAQQKYSELGLGSELRLEVGTCGHWAEAAFPSSLISELMTPYFESNKEQPISVVTLAALKDLGFEVVYDLADDYDVTGNSRFLRPARSTNHAKPWSPLRAVDTFSIEGRVLTPERRNEIRLNK